MKINFIEHQRCLALIKSSTLLFLLLVNLPASAAGLDATINAVVQPLTDAVKSFIFFEVSIFGSQLPLIILWLISAAVFFTFYLGFLNLRGFKQAFRLLRGDYSKPEHSGDISHFQALATAVSGTVGIGNMSGVAIVISIGGPGAIFC